MWCTFSVCLSIFMHLGWFSCVAYIYTAVLFFTYCSAFFACLCVCVCVCVCVCLYVCGHLCPCFIWAFVAWNKRIDNTYGTTMFTTFPLSLATWERVSLESNAGELWRWSQVLDTLQRVLNAAARLVSCTRKYDRGLSTLLHNQLHWLNVPERVETSWLSWCAGVSRTKLQGTWSSAALRSSTSPADIDVQPTCTVWLFRGVDEAQSAVGPLRKCEHVFSWHGFGILYSFTYELRFFKWYEQSKVKTCDATMRDWQLEHS